VPEPKYTDVINDEQWLTAYTALQAEEQAAVRAKKAEVLEARRRASLAELDEAVAWAKRERRRELRASLLTSWSLLMEVVRDALAG
jgi:hypothetical protein